MPAGFVTLTYDGSQMCHLETAFPQLEECGLKGTFYCEPALLLECLPEWADVLASGHELGNGALHGAVLDDGSLPGWTAQMVEQDVAEARSLIEDLFPEQGRHSFAFPWGLALSDGVDVSPAVHGVYDVVRTGQHGVNKLPLDPLRVLCVQCDDLDACDLVRIAQQSLEPSTWVVFSFEGVGVGDRAIDAFAHRELLMFLATDPQFTVLPLVHAADALLPQAAPNYKLV